MRTGLRATPRRDGPGRALALACSLGSKTKKEFSAQPRSRMWRRLVIWAALYVVLMALYNRVDPAVSAVAIHYAQVRPAAWLIRWTSSKEPVQAVGTSVESPACRITLMRGCDGFEAWLLLATALAAFPMSMRRRALGLLWGSVLVIGLNWLRIASLFHIVRLRPDWFEVAHGLVWQTLIVAAVGGFAWAWMKVDDAKAAEPQGGA